ncbi:hypothetical protein EPN96_01880 [bacterium]|nr:MAG: hypothetical protein EPN96_01880 [bacterium]
MDKKEKSLHLANLLGYRARTPRAIESTEEEKKESAELWRKIKENQEKIREKMRETNPRGPLNSLELAELREMRNNLEAATKLSKLPNVFSDNGRSEYEALEAIEKSYLSAHAIYRKALECKKIFTDFFDSLSERDENEFLESKEYVLFCLDLKDRNKDIGRWADELVELHKMFMEYWPPSDVAKEVERARSSGTNSRIASAKSRKSKINNEFEEFAQFLFVKYRNLSKGTIEAKVEMFAGEGGIEYISGKLGDSRGKEITLGHFYRKYYYPLRLSVT